MQIKKNGASDFWADRQKVPANYYLIIVQRIVYGENK